MFLYLFFTINIIIIIVTERAGHWWVVKSRNHNRDPHWFLPPVSCHFCPVPLILLHLSGGARSGHVSNANLMISYEISMLLPASRSCRMCLIVTVISLACIDHHFTSTLPMFVELLDENQQPKASVSAAHSAAVLTTSRG